MQERPCGATDEAANKLSSLQTPKLLSRSPACGSTPQICTNRRNLRFPCDAHKVADQASKPPNFQASFLASCVR